MNNIWILRTGMNLALALGLAGLVGCAAAGSEPVEEPVLEDLAALQHGVPDKADLVDEKTDVIPPARFDLMEYQSPVRSQGRRGVCSIFGSVALMEHLYILEGTISDPDFSEQYLQWAVKFQVGAFPRSSGSNASYNLQAISRYGIVTEDVWPYDRYPWSSSDDEACDGSDDQPVRCYTNGDPPPEAEAAPKYHLPAGRYISPRVNSIKAFMINKGQAVQVGGDFFYQAWNHGASKLPTNRSYWRKGYVLYPNDADKQSSREHPAGHSFLLVGWDDDLEVQQVDGEGNYVTDADGNPVKEKGFFLFKNSWGTGSFGSENPMGDGYGWISYRYVEDFLSARASDLPDVEPPREVCGDGKDNDGNDLTDCDDPACSEEPQCQQPGNHYRNDTAVAIPDDDPAGATSTLDVDLDCPIASLTLEVDITHTYRGDLEIRLRHPDGSERQILAPSSESGDDIKQSFVEERFNGLSSLGTWTLQVIDHARIDTGTLNSWSLTFTCGEPGGGGEGSLLLSEYVEGSSYNKAVEIYNAGTGAQDLSHCQLFVYSNGASTPSSSLDLSGTLSPGAVTVICHSSFAEPTLCQQSSGSLNFNGDDALELVCDGQTQDVFGRIGERLVWGDTASSQDQTLRRLCTVTSGDRDGSDAFDPDQQWQAFAKDDFSGLGAHCN